jgi:hypothetical protein
MLEMMQDIASPEPRFGKIRVDGKRLVIGRERSIERSEGPEDVADAP